MRISLFLRTALALSILLVSVSLTNPAAAQGTTCPNAPQPRLVVGRQAHVTPGAPNNVRAQPSRSAQVLTQIPGDSYIDVIGGPTCADNMAWWQIRYGGNETGWMAEGSGKTYYVEPTTSPITLFTVSDRDQTVTILFGNIRLTYNGIFGPKAEGTTVYAVQQNPDNPLYPWGPAYTNLQFPMEGQDPYRQPYLSVYPAVDYQQVNEYAARQITALRALLQAKPANPTDTIPTLPSVNAAQVFHANVRYMTFGDGTGVRFITTFAQGIMPVTNDQLWCLFQGLSHNGDYFVTAWFPIRSSLLPDTFADAKDFPDLSSPQAVDLFRAYLNKTTAKLNSAAPGDFKPSLDDVDALLQSLTIQ